MSLVLLLIKYDLGQINLYKTRKTQFLPRRLTACELLQSIQHMVTLQHC